jgi:hypothetical protein
VNHPDVSTTGSNGFHRQYAGTVSRAFVVTFAVFALALCSRAQLSAKAVTLEQALAQIEALKKQTADLEKLVRDQLQPRTVVAPSQPPSSAAVRTDTSPDSGFVKWSELVLGKSKFRLYGALREDVIYDDSRPNNTQIPAYIRSEDPAAPAAIASVRHSADLTIHSRLTRLGVDFFGPAIAPLGDATTSGKVEVDFYNLPSSESRNALRMRHAYLKLTWAEASLLAGQTSDIISPVAPVVNPDFVMWGAGNLGDRRPQIRGEWTPKAGPGKLILQGEVGLTGAIDAQDFDPAATGAFRDGEASGKPTLQARVAYSLPLWDKQRLELGVWGHRAWERTETPIGVGQKKEFESEVVGLDLTLPLYLDVVWLKGELWKGKNLSDVRGAILQGINTATGREVHALGGWFEFGARLEKSFSVHAGYTTDNPADADLVGASPPGRSRNRVWYGAVRGYFDPIEVGLDYLHWTTDWVGFGPGVDNRFQGFMSYKF